MALAKSFNNFGGLDLRSSDLNRPENAATSFLNKQFTKSGALEDRPGYKAAIASQGGHGLFVYKRINQTTGASTDELLTVSNTLYKAVETTITVAYSGSNTVLFRLFLDTSVNPYVFKCQIDEGSTNRLNYSLVNGFDETTPITLANLKTQIDAISGGLFTATISGTNSIPAAFLPLTRDVILTTTNTSVVLTAYSWVEANKTISAPLAGSETNKNSADFENVSIVQVNEAVYFGNGYDEIQKYDGQTFYRAGMPQPTLPSIAESAAAGAAKEVSTITCLSEAATTNGTGFVIFDRNGSVGVFIDKNAGGISIPGYFAGKTRTIRFDTITTGMTAAQVAVALAAKLDADAEFVAPVPGAAIVTVTDAQFGERQDIADGTPATGWAFAVTTQGSAGIEKSGSRYNYSVTHFQKDAVNQETEGLMSEDALDPTDSTKTGISLSDTDKNVNVTVTNLAAGSGYNTNCAIVNGAQTGVTTITVDTGHTIKVGDTAYFLDGVSSLYVERPVTAIAATTITISGANVNVADNAVISNNLRVRIWRNQAGGTFKSLVVELPNDSFNATQVYADSKKDSELGFEYEQPLVSHGLPPKGKYLATWNGVLLIAGNATDVNNLFYSSIESPEYFPPDRNQFLIQSSFGDVIRGIGPNNEVFVVYNEKSLHQISGDITSGLVRIDQILVNEIGTQSHASIIPSDKENIFLDDSGFYNHVAGQLPGEIGFPIKSFFTENQQFELGVFALRRAVSFNDRKNDRFLCFVPVETSTAGDKYATTESKVLVFDYARRAWYEWRNINAAAGMVNFNGELWFQERRYSTFNSSVDHITYRVQSKWFDSVSRTFIEGKDEWAYADQRSMMTTEYGSTWYDYGDPGVFKKDIRIKPYVLENVDPEEFTVKIQTEINSQRGTTESDFNMELGSVQQGWGFGSWGAFAWGNPGGDEPLNQRLKPTKFRNRRVIFKNVNIHESVVISGFEIEFATPYRPHLKE